MRLRSMLEAEFVREPKSGFGFEMFLPYSPHDFGDVSEGPPSHALFEEVGEVVRKLHSAPNNALLVEGQPGAGKSHLRDDITIARAAVSGVPYLEVTLHINGSKASGADNFQHALDRLAAYKDITKLVVFDNVDYLGYKGHRTRTQTKLYATAMSKIIIDTVHNENFAVMGTAHDDDWRAGRWGWNDEEIYEAAQAALDAFNATHVLDGTLTVNGMHEIAQERKLGQDFVDMLSKAGLKTFFHFKHIDPALFRSNPEQALEKIEQGRLQRKQA